MKKTIRITHIGTKQIVTFTYEPIAIGTVARSEGLAFSRALRKAMYVLGVEDIGLIKIEHITQ